MPVSGPIVHHQLMQSYQEAQHELESARGQIAAAGAQMSQLDTHRGEAIIDLAQHYLPELTRDAIRQTWVEVQQAIEQVLMRKEQHAQKLIQQLQSLGRVQTDGEARLKAISEQLDEATESQGKISNAVSAELAADPSFAELSDKAAQAEAALQRAEANLNEIEQDVRRKLPAYENSALFVYLYKRNFLTPQYEHRGMTRSMDQWLGRYINYREARQGYEFLKTTPIHMKEVIAGDRKALNTVMGELEKKRDVVASRHGLPAAIQKTTQLTGQRQSILAELDQNAKAQQEVEAERTKIEDPRGPYYNEAITKFRDMLAATDPQLLAQRARATPQVDDDRIVAQLEGLSENLQHLGEQVRQRQRQLEHLGIHVQSIGSIISRFRAAGYDSSRAQFSVSEDIGEQLRAARDGHFNYEDVWQQLRRTHRWGPSAVDQFTRVATHPMTQVLINAMAHAAAGAMEAHARQAGERRTSSRSDYGGGSRRSDGGFSNRDSF